jgi:hypothetical protein
MRQLKGADVGVVGDVVVGVQVMRTRKQMREAAKTLQQQADIGSVVAALERRLRAAAAASSEKAASQGARIRCVQARYWGHH